MEVFVRRMIVELRNKFKNYAEGQLIWLLRMFAHSIYWHSSTWIDEDRVLNSPFSAISELSYQDLLAFHYYITVDSREGWSERNLFTNSWNNPPHTYDTYSMYTNHWVRPCDLYIIFIKRSIEFVLYDLVYKVTVISRFNLGVWIINIF